MKMNYECVTYCFRKQTIKIKFDDHDLKSFPANIGSPQGDGISGTFFNIELENALRRLREKLIEDRSTSLPPEIEYADDTDFIYLCTELASRLKEIVKPILAERNLKVNDDKTEETSVFRAETKELELWRKVKKLGSLLGDFEDMKRRTTLAVTSQKSIEGMFKKSKASLEEKAKVYRSVFKHVLTFNMGSIQKRARSSRQIS